MSVNERKGSKRRRVAVDTDLQPTVLAHTADSLLVFGSDNANVITDK